jgi:prolipoprotein diacylglyceryltransferase
VIDPAVADKLPGVFDALHLPINWISPNAFNDGKEMLDRLLIARDPKAVEAVANILPPRHPSQLYEALLEGLLLFIICWTIGRKWRRDGMAGGAFLTFYPIMRIISEQFRVGDTPVQILGMQISKGILYSIPMGVIGVIYWAYFMVREKPNNVWHPFPVEMTPEPQKPDQEPPAK